MFLNPDLHMHSTFSDGSDTPREIVEKARLAGLDVFSITDHDTYDACALVQQYLQPGDPAFIGGIELSCEDETGKYHILGYSYDVNKQSIRDAVAITHNARRQKALNRINFLKERFGFVFTEEESQTLLENKNPGKPHFVALLMKKGYVADKKTGFELMSEYHGKERRLTPEEAVDAILSADGIPVLAHGILGDGGSNLTYEEVEARIKHLKLFGLMGAECYYSTYTPEQKQIMLDLASKYHLLITAGSDYHGKNKPITMGMTNTPDPQKMDAFFRAAQALKVF